MIASVLHICTGPRKCCTSVLIAVLYKGEIQVPKLQQAPARVQASKPLSEVTIARYLFSELGRTHGASCTPTGTIKGVIRVCITRGVVTGGGGVKYRKEVGMYNIPMVSIVKGGRKARESYVPSF